MITDRTRNILIESAWWDPITVRKMARRHGLHTDASHRFERGADIQSTIPSTNRVAELILASGGGTLAGDVIDVVAGHRDQAPVLLELPEVRRILGKDLPLAEITRILTKLGFEFTPELEGGSELTVTIPSWRLDVEREIDIIEEIARIHGYDNFPNTLPAFAGGVIEQPDALKNARIRASLLGLGYNEAISLTFVSHDEAKQFASTTPLELANPQSEEASCMRTSLVPGMLNMLAWNLNRGVDNVRLFEAGQVYVPEGTAATEPSRLCVGATGAALPHNVLQPQEARALTFFDVKGDVETVLEAFAARTLHYDRETASYYHPGRSARAVLDGTPVAQFGQLHPDIAATRKLRQDVFLAEFDLNRLYEVGLREPQFKPLPRYPAVERDFSFLLPDAVVFEDLDHAVAGLKLAELRSFEPVEIFRGGNVAAGQYSILVRATFQSGERTLREEEIAQWSGRIIQALQALGGTLRA